MKNTNFKLKTNVLNRAVSITALLLAAALLFTGCPQKVKEESKPDKTPPKEVTGLQAVAGGGKVSLSWTNPADNDLYQVEITASPAAGSLANPVYLAAEKGKAGSYSVTELASDTEYTLTVKTIDKALNKSAGVSKTVRTQTVPDPGATMEITLSQSPATPTNGNVTISFTSSTSVKTAKWAKGVKSVGEVLSSGTPITGNSFEVIENAKYSVGVQDNEGRREVRIIEITNIDKEPPEAPSGFTAAYDFSQKKIRLSWTDPADIGSGLKELRLTYTVNGAAPTTETITVGTKAFELNNIEPQSPRKTYAFSLKALDNVGNEGAVASQNLELPLFEEVAVTTVELNRTHLDTIMTNRDIRVTIRGVYFDKLTSIAVRVTDGSTPEVPAAINAPNHEATATVQAPTPSSPTDEGTEYTVEVIVNGATVSDKKATFKVTNPAKVGAITLTPAGLIAGSAPTVHAEVTGTNFDIRGLTKIKLLDKNGVEVAGSTVEVPADVGNATSFSKEIPVPATEGEYTAAVYFADVKETVTGTLQVSGAPEITSITIPRAGKSYAGNKLPVTIEGKNFDAPGISAASFSGSGAGITNFEIISSTLARAEVTCPSEAGTTVVTVNCGEASKTGMLEVTDYSVAGYEAGKIVLANRTLVAKNNYNSINTSNPPIGILCGGHNTYGVPLMVALHTQELAWAKQGSVGATEMFYGIICTPSAQGIGHTETVTFTDDTDGSDNWDYICSKDPAGTANAAENYPAFNWVNTYNTKYATQLGSAKPAWYMPSIAELCKVYNNRGAINASLAKINGLTNGSTYAPDSSFGTRWFWSSSQCPSSIDGMYAWCIVFRDSDLRAASKEFDLRVCCVAGF